MTELWVNWTAARTLDAFVVTETQSLCSRIDNITSIHPFVNPKFQQFVQKRYITLPKRIHAKFLAICKRILPGIITPDLKLHYIKFILTASISNSVAARSNLCQAASTRLASSKESSQPSRDSAFFWAKYSLGHWVARNWLISPTNSDIVKFEADGAFYP